MPLPPTIDEAIKLIRSYHRSVTVGQLADAVINHGWDVDRAELIERIRTLFPARGTSRTPLASADKRQRRENDKVGRAPHTPAKKPKKSGISQIYCPTCNVFVVITHSDGVSTFAQHKNKKGQECPRSGKPYTKRRPVKRDAMELRVPGSYGTGKHR